ncbi:uncharacterized protein LOC123413422 isoform X2 [Hordeum vulgare subsp. vulgare]|uniref:uncharacterized protein LOC123413422 isoform X2 n=1 Tax=Hordeum vulgare subsp. vulgare TaxID=112509 RepID=UPI001D1A4600|nr:uncharacterized protein LOC123413422 isoform X2 [Hordeum vulgare subsp. vulgare]
MERPSKLAKTTPWKHRIAALSPVRNKTNTSRAGRGGASVLRRRASPSPSAPAASHGYRRAVLRSPDDSPLHPRAAIPHLGAGPGARSAIRRRRRRELHPALRARRPCLVDRLQVVDPLLIVDEDGGWAKFQKAILGSRAFMIILQPGMVTDFKNPPLEGKRK